MQHPIPHVSSHSPRNSIDYDVGRCRVVRHGADLPDLCVVRLQVNEAVVKAVGPGRRNIQGELVPMSVKEGDKVLLPEYGGSLVKLTEKE